MSNNITRATVTDKNKVVTVKLVGYDYKATAWAMIQLMDAVTYRDKPAEIIAVDSDNFTINFKNTDGPTVMALMRELVDFDEIVETMTENGIACQWELTNW